MSAAVLLMASAPVATPAQVGSRSGDTPRVGFDWNEDEGWLRIRVDDREVVRYVYGDLVDLPHFFPVRSPSGQLLTVQQIEPYPHHRSVWFADTVALAGHRQVSFYNALYSRVDPDDPNSPFRDRIRQAAFQPGRRNSDTAEMTFLLRWEMDQGTPVLDEQRRLRVRALEAGEYFLDLRFTLTAAYGAVSFESDAVHYAWPFVRMHPQFSVDRGGAMVNSEGGRNQAGTHDQVARWVDYSNTVDGQTEGLAIFSHPDNPHPHKWLTRDYGTFGPRRPDARSGKRFVLERGESLVQRVGLLVHRGDAASSRVAERYQAYAAGKL